MRSGARNLITDVAGLRVGNFEDSRIRSGVTVILPQRPVKAAADIRGGGPGTRETAAMAAGGVVKEIHSLVLSGGSAFGLDAATGAQSWLREKGIGFAVGPVTVPIVPQAILFDLFSGGDKNWGRHPPYRDMAYEACGKAAGDFRLGTAGAGFGASVAFGQDGRRMMGGLGSASLVTEEGITIGALAAVNAGGSVVMGEGPHFWAAPLEIGSEFGGLGWPPTFPETAHRPILKGAPGENTTLGVIATDADLSREDLRRLAVMAQTGLARAIYPVHTPLDGDVVFALSTGEKPPPPDIWSLARLGAAAANALARAVARGVYEAEGFPDDPISPPTYASLFGRVKTR